MGDATPHALGNALGDASGNAPRNALGKRGSLNVACCFPEEFEPV